MGIRIRFASLFFSPLCAMPGYLLGRISENIMEDVLESEYISPVFFFVLGIYSFLLKIRNDFPFSRPI